MIGNGNVAIDVARMLVLDPEELAPTDTADHAITALRQLDRRRGRAARPPRPGAGGVHQPGGPRARRARARRRGLRPRSRSRTPPSPRRRPPRRNVEMFRDYALARAVGQVAPDRAALPALPAGDPRRGRGRPGDRRARLGQPARGTAARRPDRRGGGHRVRARAALDRLPRPPARRHPVRRAPRPDPQRGRPRATPARRAAASTPSAGSSAAPPA